MREYLKQKNNTNFKEKLSDVKISENTCFIILFLVLGLGGLGFLLNDMTYCSKDYSHDIYDHKSMDDIRSKETKQLYTKQEVEQPRPQFAVVGDQLTISSSPEVGTPTIFKVEQFDPKATYILNYGDKYNKILNTNTDAHTYRTPGTYDVSLTVKYKNKSKVLATKTITVFDAIDVSMYATDIDF